jgi:8-oxo-dGTP diphosphatase
VEVFLARLQSRLASGLRLVQLREKNLSGQALEKLASEVLRLAHAHGAKVLINADIELARRMGADGVHLTAVQLAQLGTRPELAWVGASCHGAQELRAAEALGVDFAVLGPVFATPTHPDAALLGWDGFAALVRGAIIPVYALGGVKPAMLDAARERGAHGLAMISGSWKS